MSEPDLQLATFLAALAVAVILVIRFEIICLRELAATPENQLRTLTRKGWLAAILIAVPFGGVAFLLAGRNG